MKTVLTFIISIIGIVSAQADTIPSFKLPKNHIQFGLTSINFMDGYGYKTSRIYDKEIRFGDFSLSFSRYFKNNLFTSITYYRYDRNNYMKYRGQTNFEDVSHGEILSKHLRIITLNLGKTYIKPLNSKINVYLNPILKLSYRFGSDEIFLGTYPGGFDFASVGVQSKGFGLGIGAEIGLIAYKHFSLSASLNYNYIFERGKYEEFQPEYFKYTPSRNILTFQPKIGFLF